jgi:hypothetical protein
VTDGKALAERGWAGKQRGTADDVLRDAGAPGHEVVL